MSLSSIEDASSLARGKTTWIFDLDGVIYTGSEVVPGAAEAIDRLKAAGRRVVYLTNNSTSTREDYASKLGAMGMQARIEDVFTSAWITADWLARNQAGNHDNTLVYVIGERGIQLELASKGFRVLGVDDFQPADWTLRQGVSHVVVGLDRNFTYAKLAVALDCLNLGGASFLATNDDASLPVEGGRVAPGAGALVRALATCAGRDPDHGSPFGKPNPVVFDMIEHATGVPRREMIMVGDRVETDILAANRAGVTSVLVLTGVTRPGDAIPASMVPRIVLPSIASIPLLLEHVKT